MFGDKQAAQLQSVACDANRIPELRNAGIGSPPKPNDGITTAMTELIDVAQRNAGIVNLIESNLGISSPETAGGNAAQQAGSLRDVIVTVTNRLREANYTLERIDEHLIS